MNSSKEAIENLVEQYIPEDYFNEAGHCVNGLSCDFCSVAKLIQKAGYTYSFELTLFLGIQGKKAGRDCPKIIKWNNQTLDNKKLKAILQ
jgi:hypothetical protein